MRELTTDRPDLTESPITVDKGHFQIELDIAAFAHRSSTHIFDVGGINAKLGLSDNVDIQLVTQAYERLKFGSTTRTSTFPDLTARLKVNLRGNDGGPSALALMPFLTTGGPLGFGAGLIVPWSRDLSDKWSIAAMTEIDASSSSDPTLVNSVSFGRSLSETLGTYFELASVLPDLAPRGMAWMFDTGLTRSVNANLQLDAGVNIGLNDRAERIRVFAGVSRRY